MCYRASFKLKAIRAAHCCGQQGLRYDIIFTETRFGSRVRTVDSETGGGATWEGDRLLVLSYRHAPLGQLLALDSGGHSRVLVSQQDWAMNGVAAIKGGILSRCRAAG